MKFLSLDDKIISDLVIYLNNLQDLSLTCPLINFGYAGEEN